MSIEHPCKNLERNCWILSFTSFDKERDPIHGSFLRNVERLYFILLIHIYAISPYTWVISAKSRVRSDLVFARSVVLSAFLGHTFEWCQSSSVKTSDHGFPCDKIMALRRQCNTLPRHVDLPQLSTEYGNDAIDAIKFLSCENVWSPDGFLNIFAIFPVLGRYFNLTIPLTAAWGQIWKRISTCIFRSPCSVSHYITV